MIVAGKGGILFWGFDSLGWWFLDFMSDAGKQYSGQGESDLLDRAVGESSSAHLGTACSSGAAKKKKKKVQQAAKRQKK